MGEFYISCSTKIALLSRKDFRLYEIHSRSLSTLYSCLPCLTMKLFLLTLCGALCSSSNVVFAMDKYADNFQRIATFSACQQLDLNCNTNTQTEAHDITASGDGNTLLYTDPPMKSVGFVDITYPSNPIPLGFFQLDTTPTALATAGPYALVTVDDSSADDFVNTAGRLFVIDIEDRSLITSIDLGGQPSDIAVSPDGTYALVAIQNQRNPSVGDGYPPQAPAGFLVAIALGSDNPTEWTPTVISLSNLVNIRFNEDPEPKSISINDENIAAVTLQANNAIVLVDLNNMSILNSIDAGFVSVDRVDLTPDFVVEQRELAFNYLREPDGIVWMGDRYFVTADEGTVSNDYKTRCVLSIVCP